MHTSHLAHIEHHLVSSLLSPEAKTQYARGDIAKRELLLYVDALRAISTRYVSHVSGTQLASPIDSAVAAAAYALYYTPINAAKLFHFIPLLSCPERPLRVLDLGSGPGTAGLALRASLSQRLSLTCIEHSPPMRALANQLIPSFAGTAPLAGLTTLSALKNLPHESRFDLVIAANVFAELDEVEAQKTLETLANAVDSSGYLVLLEPGQLLHTRRLMALRDRVTSNHTRLTPIFPCLRADACPMLAASSTDWCHGALEWQQPRLHRQLDDLLGFNKHRIKFSCFIFHDGAHLGDGVRVLTPPEKGRAGVEALVCGRELYGIARVPKRLRSELTRPFEKAKVYERLSCAPAFVGDAPDGAIIKRVSEL